MYIIHRKKTLEYSYLDFPYSTLDIFTSNKFQ